MSEVPLLGECFAALIALVRLFYGMSFLMHGKIVFASEFLATLLTFVFSFCVNAHVDVEDAFTGKGFHAFPARVISGFVLSAYWLSNPSDKVNVFMLDKIGFIMKCFFAFITFKRFFHLGIICTFPINAICNNWFLI